MAASKSNTSTTAVQYRADDGESLYELRAALAALEHEQMEHQDKLIEIDGAVNDSDVLDLNNPVLRRFVREALGPLILDKVGSWSTQIDGSFERRKAGLNRSLSAVQGRTLGNAARHAELAAQIIGAAISHEHRGLNLGNVYVSALDAPEPDHAGHRIGSVLVTIENPALPESTIRAILVGLFEGLGLADPAGDVTPGSRAAITSGEAFAYKVRIATTDPEVVANAERDHAQESADSLSRAQYIADRGQVW
ncbi:hypothetical protein ACFFX1_08180 [Dactylosporangium sucinum]|uniref:Uncharacterized protein n=1 Tax=Dactylosporangium sucinum TaxID=1424081 RepID=A0A917U3E6_9ACTN|nr:hypothetical protein [Dactylosporangium sucinum]GGM55526.1 hypothetical protein GCM10007977_066530 [Dactylosporangium sucinum]